MDKTYKKKIIGMAMPVLVSLLIIVICTLCQKEIIRQFGKFILGNPQYSSLITSGYSPKTIVPVYMFATVFSAVLLLIATIIVVSSEKMKTKTGAGIALIIYYFASISVGFIYYVAGGDKLIFGQDASLNIDILSMVTSLLVSPVMMVYFAFFMVTVITFIIKSKKIQNNKT